MWLVLLWLSLARADEDEEIEFPGLVVPTEAYPSPEDLDYDYDRDPPIRCHYEWIEEPYGFRLERSNCYRGKEPWPKP